MRYLICFYGLTITIMFSFQSCEKDDFSWNLKKAPEVGYLAVEYNNTSDFKLSTNCVSSGYDKNVEMGFCWSLTPNPTVDDNMKIVSNKKEGEFYYVVPWTSTSTYHFRAFVRNGIGTVYSQDCYVYWPGSTALPQIETINADQISFHSFNVNSNVLNSGGNPIIEKGVKLYSGASTLSSNLIQTCVSTSINNSFTTYLSGLTDGTTYCIQSYITTLAGTTFSNAIVVNTPLRFGIGDVGPSGGFIIYENPDSIGSWHYLEAALVDIPGTFKWTPYTATTNATSLELGQGSVNTQQICFLYSATQLPYAALAANNWSYGGYSDWVLPSFYELKMMKETLYNQGTGNFINGTTYWSSSEDSNYSINSWTVKMAASPQNLFVSQTKEQLFKVRAIRRF
jgi:hypothetical protein